MRIVIFALVIILAIAARTKYTISVLTVLGIVHYELIFVVVLLIVSANVSVSVYYNVVTDAVAYGAIVINVAFFSINAIAVFRFHKGAIHTSISINVVINSVCVLIAVRGSFTHFAVGVIV
jgi:hypothetical protein